MKKIILVAFTALSVSMSVFASQADLDQEVAHYTRLFSKDDVVNQRTHIDELAYTGITDLALFDLVAKKLREYTFNEKDAEKSAWYAKALAASGNEKYKALLEEIRDKSISEKIKRYARQSLLRLEKHSRWNPVISANVVSVPDGGLKQQRLLNMLSASDLELVRLAAKGVYKKHSNNNVLIDAAAKRLELEFANYRKGDTILCNMMYCHG